MEDIYGDLYNYENVNVVQELRVENKALKVKVEDLSTAMEKLQKEILQDFDTLDKDFKTLHKNYHSLLKTARAEVKRKTDMITQLNVEKDLLLLESLKRGQNIRRLESTKREQNIKRNFNQGNEPGLMNVDRSSGEKNNINNKENVKKKNDETEHERRKMPVLPPKEADPESGTCNRSKFDYAGEKEKKELPNNKKSSVNENILQHKTEHNGLPKTYARSIKDRRKSMPAVSIPPDTFSSDDELKQNYQTKDTRTDHLRSEISVVNNEWRNINKTPIDRHSNKTSSETASVDNRGHNIPEFTLRDNYQHRSNRHYDSTTYRGRDKYEISLKYRKQYSPERGQKRQYREHQNDYYQHDRRYPGRSVESPPPESTYKSHNCHQRQRSAHQSDYDRYSHDYDKKRHYHDSKYSSKYRKKDHDEPLTKKQRTESYGDPNAHSKEGWRRYHERESMDAQPAPCFSPHEYDMLRFSCQSPDSVHTDAPSADPVKEIMGTAATPLEDPRVTSKRYVIGKENGVEILSTAVGRNIEMIPVNKAAWDIKPVDIPDALVRRPSECSDTLVNYIYSDIDNTVTNLDLSMGSGGVRETDDIINVNRSKPKELQHDTQSLKISERVPDLLKQATDVGQVEKSNLTKYRIPKIGKDNKNTNTQSKMDVPVIDIGDNEPLHKNVYRKVAAEVLPNNKICSKMHEGNKKSRSRERVENQNQAILTKMAIVADDLELSDDNSDHMDTNRSVVSDKLQKKCEMPLNINKASTDDSVVYKTVTSSHNTESEKQAVDAAKIKDVTEEKSKESDITKKHSKQSKKKKSKSKEDLEVVADGIHVPEKKPKSRKEKESKSKETKEKFSDLFGDSNSLMTPEDLGIPSYLPICEDAQDAVDMKINQIIDATPLIHTDEIPSDTQTQSRVEVKIQDTIALDEIPKPVLRISNTNVDDREDLNETKKKKSSKRSEVTIDPNQLPSPIVYENLNPGVELNDRNVVKTVIISTGTQPEMAYENKIDVTKPATDVEVNAIQNTKDIHLFPATMEFKRDMLKALATSTPHKELSPVNPLQAEFAKTDVTCDPRVSAAVATITNVEQVVNQTEPNTLEDNDAPDVRIFVKRRRKVVKRPPMT